MKAKILLLVLVVLIGTSLSTQLFSQGNALNFGGSISNGFNNSTSPMVSIPHSNSFISPQVTVELWVKLGIPDGGGFQSILTRRFILPKSLWFYLFLCGFIIQSFVIKQYCKKHLKA